MASSSNRFAVLGEDSSSSKEQEVPVPVTGTEGMGNQTMQDTAQAGPPISSGSPEGSAAPKLTIEEGVALFLKRRAQYLAEEEEKEKAKKSRQNSKPSTSAIPPRGLRKRSASSDEAEEPPKRQRMESHSRSQTVQEVPVAAPTTESDRETEEPNDVKGETTSAMVVQEDPYLFPPSSFEWRNIRMPKNPLLCIVQVNNSTRIGSFDKNTKDWAFKLTFDADRRQIPTMTMKFFSNGIKGPQSAQTGWCLGEWMAHDWMVTDYKVHRVADCAEKGQIRHPYVLGLCKTDEEKARLVCISLKAWPKILGHFDSQNRWKNPRPGVKKLFSAVLTGRRPYHLRIWFLAPDDLETFERQCLSIFTLFFHQRKPNYYGICDAHGVGFNL